MICLKFARLGGEVVLVILVGSLIGNYPGQSANQDAVGVILGKGQGFGIGGGPTFELAAAVFQAAAGHFFVRGFQTFSDLLASHLENAVKDARC